MEEGEAPRHITVADAAQRLGVHVGSARKLAASGRLGEAMQVDGRWLVSVDGVEAYAARRAPTSRALERVGHDAAAAIPPALAPVLLPLVERLTEAERRAAAAEARLELAAQNEWSLHQRIQVAERRAAAAEARLDTALEGETARRSRLMDGASGAEDPAEPPESPERLPWWRRIMA
jgi:hypothetical protein